MGVGPRLRGLPRILLPKDKRCILASLRVGADFSRGCAHSAVRLLISTTHPLPFDSRIDSERSVLATPLVRIYARLWKRPSEKPLLALWYIRARCWTLQLRETLRFDLRLLSVGGGSGCLRWCMAYPALGAILLGSDGAARECFRRAPSSPA